MRDALSPSPLTAHLGQLLWSLATQQRAVLLLGGFEATTEDKEEAPAASATITNTADGEETVTVEELEEQLKQSHAETAAVREQVTALTQQLATSVPRAEALIARRDLERRIETLTRDNQTLTEAVEKEQKEREWLEGELRAQYEAAEGTDQEMTNLQTFVRKLHALVEDKTKTLDTQKVLRQPSECEDT
ncbi:hypothetical protein E2C01_010681 [Portunus trituberculatus]|uniref:Uncharacterized protein n=1 Tax=Portunus trituberculatus TaxID=210409 RepID=A0A5B7D9I0_PORTR|nr:hypothetical protein [Portunus trituberculatus]